MKITSDTTPQRCVTTVLLNSSDRIMAEGISSGILDMIKAGDALAMKRLLKTASKAVLDERDKVIFSFTEAKFQ
jgi:hypothetical protein